MVTDPVLGDAGSAYAVGRGPLSARLQYRHLHSPAGREHVPREPDVVLLSHDQHGDNLDEGGRHLLARARIVLTTASGAARLRRRGIPQARGLLPGEAMDIDGLRITATPARHGPPFTTWLTGEVIGFVIEGAALSHGPIYITGDTRLTRSVLDAAAAKGRFSTIFAHAGAASILGLRFSMNGRDLRLLNERLRPRQLIPIHFAGWSHFSEGRAELEQAFARNEQGAPLRFLHPGRYEPLDLDESRAPTRLDVPPIVAPTP